VKFLTILAIDIRRAELTRAGVVQGVGLSGATRRYDATPACAI
jgi:hypothetical protein